MGTWGDFGTVIIHDMAENGKTATQMASTKAEELLPATRHDGSPSVSGLGDVAIDSWMNSTADVGTPAGGSQATLPMSLPHKKNLKANSIPQVIVGSVPSLASSVTSETLSRKALDKLWSIYSAGNTAPIPFLRVTDISPIALVSDNALGAWQQHSVEVMLELFSDDAHPKKCRSRLNQVPLSPSVYQSLDSSPSLMNLAQALAYHKMCNEEMLLQEMQATQEQQAIQNLSDTL